MPAVDGLKVRLAGRPSAAAGQATATFATNPPESKATAAVEATNLRPHPPLLSRPRRTAGLSRRAFNNSLPPGNHGPARITRDVTTASELYRQLTATCPDGRAMCTNEQTSATVPWCVDNLADVIESRRGPLVEPTPAWKTTAKRLRHRNYSYRREFGFRSTANRRRTVHRHDVHVREYVKGHGKSMVRTRVDDGTARKGGGTVAGDAGSRRIKVLRRSSAPSRSRICRLSSGQTGAEQYLC
jgi:hypothetical protein